MASAPIPVDRPRLPTLIRGAGNPRLPLKTVFRGAIWSGFAWLTYPYAVDLALWQGAERYVGLGSMAVVAFAGIRALKSWARVAWHVGLVGLLAIGLSAGAAVTIDRGLAARASTTSDWMEVSRSVVSDARRGAALGWERLQDLPAEVYSAATARRPFWQSEPARMMTSPPLDQPAPPGQGDLPAVLGNLHVGSIARVRAPEAGAIPVADRPGGPQIGDIVDQMVVVILDGPIGASDRIWWLVDDGQLHGWCHADQLEPFEG